MTIGVLAPILEADQREKQLLSGLTAHPILQHPETLSDQQLVYVLLQRRFISMIFTPVYDMGIDALSTQAALDVAREIVREEYPVGKPSHREDLIADLLDLGATRHQILACKPTPSTTSTLIETLELMGEAAAGGDEVRVLGMLRFWGEVVVAVEYGQFWKAIGPYFTTKQRPSCFYQAHYSHDGREPIAAASAQTHSGRLGQCLRVLLDSPGAAKSLVEIETKIVHSRLRFYDQFVTG